MTHFGTDVASGPPVHAAPAVAKVVPPMPLEPPAALEPPVALAPPMLLVPPVALPPLAVAPPDAFPPAPPPSFEQARMCRPPKNKRLATSVRLFMVLPFSDPRSGCAGCHNENTFAGPLGMCLSLIYQSRKKRAQRLAHLLPSFNEPGEISNTPDEHSMVST